MKFPISRSLLVMSLVVVSANAFSATASFEKKEVAKNGQVVYFYKYFCGNGSQGMISVNANDDAVAKKLADAKAKVVCEE